MAGREQGLALTQRMQLSALWLLHQGEQLVERGSGCFASSAAESLNPA